RRVVLSKHKMWVECIIHTDSGTTTASSDIELRSSRTDLARLVKAVSRDQFTELVLPQRSGDVGGSGRGERI
ncbi:MAG: hypothetical protein ACRDJB_12745, partial [Actinomycetota bacterium]